MHRRDYLRYSGVGLGLSALAGGATSGGAALTFPLGEIPEGPTDLAWGDVDGDGRAELAVALNTDAGPRFWVLDDEREEFAVLFSGGGGWGDGAFATAVALGDLDGDGRAELAVGRRADGNARFFVYDDADAGFQRLFRGGRQWGDADTTALAIGDLDGDGIDELAVGRRAGGNARFFVHDDARRNFRVRLRGGRPWGGGADTSALAVGDVDNDGVDELAVGRRAAGNARFFVHDDARRNFRVLFRGGRQWSADAFPTDIAFGDVDADGFEELAVARRARSNARVIVYEDADADFEVGFRAGRQWGADAFPTGIDFGDVDADGRAELVVARRARTNARYFVHDDERADFEVLFRAGAGWNADAYAGAAAIGDMDGEGLAELAVARTGQAPRVLIREDAHVDFASNGAFLFPV